MIPSDVSPSLHPMLAHVVCLRLMTVTETHDNKSGAQTANWSFCRDHSPSLPPSSSESGELGNTGLTPYFRLEPGKNTTPSMSIQTSHLHHLLLTVVSGAVILRRSFLGISPESLLFSAWGMRARPVSYSRSYHSSPSPPLLPHPAAPAPVRESAAKGNADWPPTSRRRKLMNSWE